MKKMAKKIRHKHFSPGFHFIIYAQEKRKKKINKPRRSSEIWRITLELSKEIFFSSGGGVEEKNDVPSW